MWIKQLNLEQVIEVWALINGMNKSTMNKNSVFQLLIITNSNVLSLTNITNETHINQLVVTTEIDTTVTNGNSNIRSIDLSEQITNWFNKGHNRVNEVSFY